MYKASKNLEFWGYRGEPFPGCFPGSGGSFVCLSVCNPPEKIKDIGLWASKMTKPSQTCPQAGGEVFEIWDKGYKV